MAADTVASLLAEGRRALASADTAALDARLLLQEAAGLSHAEIVAGPARAIVAEAAAAYRALLARRAAGEPVSRILGRREFYGRDFAVTPEVLDPRPDTETLVEAALALISGPARLLDLGSGSGAILVTLLAERPQATGVAVDIAPATLAVTVANARRHGVAERLQALCGGWFAPVSGCFDVIVSNPPYIADRDIAGLAREVRAHDPHLALSGGADGLAAYRAIAADAAGFLRPGGTVLVEIGAGQADAVTALFAGAGFAPRGRHRDLAGHVRVLGFSKD